MGGTLLLAASRATIPDIVVFVVGAAVILGGAIGVVTSRNPVHAALSLVLTLFGVAVLFVEENANFLAAVQVIVYAGAIVVLFLFVIMFLGVDRRENLEAEPLRGQRPVAFVLMTVALAAVLTLVATAHWVTGAHTVVGPISTPHRSEVAQLGTQLFTKYLYAFEATAALLVIAVVGAVVLARRPPARDGDDAGAGDAASAGSAAGSGGGEREDDDDGGDGGAGGSGRGIDGEAGAGAEGGEGAGRAGPGDGTGAEPDRRTQPEEVPT